MNGKQCGTQMGAVLIDVGVAHLPNFIFLHNQHLRHYKLRVTRSQSNTEKRMEVGTWENICWENSVEIDAASVEK